MDIILRRVTDLATLLTASTARGDSAATADGGTRVPRWVKGSLWLLLLFAPGSFLLLPALLWWQHRRPRQALRQGA